jgi:hypothetical protein
VGAVSGGAIELPRNRAPLSPEQLCTVHRAFRDSVRNIIVDMNAFYLPVEKRQTIRNCVATHDCRWKGNRSVGYVASYEARKFGVRSAMPTVRAERSCPESMFVAPNFHGTGSLKEACPK